MFSNTAVVLPILGFFFMSSQGMVCDFLSHSLLFPTLSPFFIRFIYFVRQSKVIMIFTWNVSPFSRSSCEKKKRRKKKKKKVNDSFFIVRASRNSSSPAYQAHTCSHLHSTQHKSCMHCCYEHGRVGNASKLQLLRSHHFSIWTSHTGHNCILLTCTFTSLKIFIIDFRKFRLQPLFYSL